MPKSARKNKEESTTAEPRFPYTVAPNSLRRLLEIIPQKPKPPKVVGSTLKTWGFKGGNDISILRVLKKIGFLAPGGEPTQAYADYMKPGTGASALGKKIRESYELLFQNVTTPEKASNEELRSFFNINSGGGERTIQYQIETFKALAVFATFGESDPLEQDDSSDPADDPASGNNKSIPAIRIDLHIHLPENKSKADYDAIMESIAAHLYKRQK